MRALPVYLRLLLSYLLVAIIPLAALGTLYLMRFEDSLRESILERMTSIADKKAEQIDTYVNERMNDLRLLVNRSSVREAAADIERYYREGGLQSPQYQAAANAFRDTIHTRLQLERYYDVLLIDRQGNVIFTLRGEADLGRNLAADEPETALLAQAWQLALSGRQAHLGQFGRYVPSGGRPAAFAVAPLLVDGRHFGAVALQIDLHELLEVTADPTGLGSSGQTVVVQRQGEILQFVTPVDGGDAFAYSITPTQASAGMLDAVAGNYGRGFTRDYRGREVVAAWRYLPALDWAMATKIDVAEALAPVASLRQRILVVLAVFLGLAVLVAWLLGRTVSVPIRRLMQTVHELSWGNLGARVQVSGSGELAQLGETFNQMASALQDATETLERKVSERTAQLQTAYAMRSAILDNANALIVVIDNQGRVMHFNHAAELLSGYRAVEIEGKDFPPVFIPPDDIEKVRREAFAGLLHDPAQVQKVYRNHWLCSNGERRLIEWNNSVIMDEHDHLRYVVSVGIDITERQKYEEQVSLITRRLNEAQRIARVGSWELDLKTDELYWSDEIFNLFQVDRNAFRASYEAFLNVIHPDDRHRVDEVFRESLQSRQPYRITHRLKLPDGSVKWVEERCETIYDDHGQPLVAKGTVQDVTAQKLVDDELGRQRRALELLVEERTRALESARHAREELAITLVRLKEAQRVARVGSWEYDVHSSKLFWSEEMYRLHERDISLGPPDYAANLEHYDDESRVKLESAMKTALAEGRRFEIELCMGFGGRKAPRWVNSICNVLRDDSGNIVSLSGTVQDITAQKLLKDELDEHRNYLELLVQQRTAELEKAKVQAELANKAKSQFLSNMSHELRTPMNAILGFTQLLQLSDRLDGQQSDYVEEILKGGYHLLELINEVLDLARIESGKLDLDIVVVNVGELVEECFSLMKPLAEKQHIELVHNELDHCHVRADRTRLRQVVLNLLSNAIKYNAGHGSVMVEVLPAAGGMLEISVIDSGWGIDAEHLGQVFEPFFRISHGEKLVEGTGIGLAITRNLVELMHGHIDVESRPGVGSRFSVTLPVAREKAGSESNNIVERSPGVDAMAGPRRRVLYIEDNPANLKLVEKILQRQPHIELITAHSALLGRDIIQTYRPEVILLDINMPHLDGYGLLEIIRSDKQMQSIPVIAITADAMPADIEKARAAGFDEYLTKPLDIRRFLEVLGRFLAAGDSGLV